MAPKDAGSILGALAQAAVWMELALSRPLDLVIVNKFGKQEAVGRGLLKPMADANRAWDPFARRSLLAES